MDPLAHGYWAWRGAGQVSRLLLAFSGACWKDVQYTQREQWFGNDKETLGLDFPNLPYLIDGNFKICESTAIHHYILGISQRQEARDALGKDLKDQVLIKQLEGVFQDGIKQYTPLFFNPNYAEKLAQATEKLEEKLRLLGKYYGEKSFALGYVTLVDFRIAEFSFYIQKLTPEVFIKYGFLKKVRQGVESLPEIKKYYEQQSSVKGPFLPPFAAIPF